MTPDTRTTENRGRALRCLVGIHSFPWPEHTNSSWGLWSDYDVECARGCGARKTLTCMHDRHWQEKHPEPEESDDR